MKHAPLMLLMALPFLNVTTVATTLPKQQLPQQRLLRPQMSRHVAVAEPHGLQQQRLGNAVKQMKTGASFEFVSLPRALQ